MVASESGSFEVVAGTAPPPTRRPQAGVDAPRPSLRNGLLQIVGAATTCAVSVGASIALIDRPVATWVHEHLGDQRFGWFTTTYDAHAIKFGPFSLMAGPSEALRPFAFFVFVVLAIAAAAGWRPGRGGRIVLAVCLSIFVASEINGVLKLAFGRPWPESWLGANPSWIRDGVFRFSPLHGGIGWASFPSGHTTSITTVATILWIVWPELRIASATIVVVVVAGLVGGNYHFVSDIIAGLFLGAAIGLGIVGLMLYPDDRLYWSMLRKARRSDESLR
jgi:membrane-associated phospholipid phosphatase